MSRTRKASSPEDTDGDEALEAAVNNVLGKRAEKRRKCFQDLQDLHDKCQEMMNMFDDSDEITTDQETSVHDCVTKFFGHARRCKTGQKHSRRQGRRLLAQRPPETCDPSVTKKITPGPDIGQETRREDDDSSASSSDFPELEFKNDSTVHVRTARRHDTVTEKAGPSVQTDTGGNSVLSQLDGALQRKPTKNISRDGQIAFKNDHIIELEQSNKSSRRTVTMSDYAAQFSDRQVIKHRGKYWILRCEVHSGLRLTKENGKEHLESEHQLEVKSFDMTLGYIGINISDYTESTELQSSDRPLPTARRSQEAGGRRNNTRERRTDGSPSALPITKGHRAEQGAATATMEQAARPVSLREEQAAVNGLQTANPNNDLQHDKEGTLRHTGRSISVAVATTPMPKVAQEPLRGSTTSLVSETALSSRVSRKRPLDLSSPNIQKLIDRPEKDNSNDVFNNTIVLGDIKQPSEAPAKGSTGARDETPDGVQGGGSESLSPISRLLQGSPNKKAKPGVQGVKVSRDLTRPRNDELEEVSSPSCGTQEHHELKSQSPPELGSHGEVLINVNQSQLCAMLDGFEKSRLATSTVAVATQTAVVAATPLRNSPAVGPLELSEEGEMTGMREIIISSELAAHHCSHCGTGFWLQYYLAQHLQQCDRQMAK